MRFLTVVLAATMIYVSGAMSKVVAQTPATITYNSGSHTYTVPQGVTHIWFQAWGAGGNSGVSTGSIVFDYSGCGGAYTESVLMPVTPGEVFAINVGIPHTIVNDYPTTNSTVRQSNNVLIIEAAGAWTFNNGVYSTPQRAFPSAIEKFVKVSYGGGLPGIANSNSPGEDRFAFFGGGGASGGTLGPGGNGATPNLFAPYLGGLPNGVGGRGGNGGFIRPSAGLGFTGEDGSAPGGGGAGGLNVMGKGANGRIVIHQCFLPGTIEESHTVPFPFELTADSIYSAEDGVPAGSPAYTWSHSPNNTTFVTTPGGFTQKSLPLNTVTLPQGTDVRYFRRTTNTCANPNTSNVVKIRVFSQANGLLNGTITGQVVSTNGVGVQGITVTAQKTIALKGSPVTKTYSAVTNTNGQYSIPNIFYGDISNGDPGNVQFTVTPSKDDHVFTPASTTVTLTNTNPTSLPQNFTDNTVYTITGKTFQECVGCLNAQDQVATIEGRVDSVEVFLNNSFRTKSGFIDPPGQYGLYSLTVTDPGNYRIEPRFKNQNFTPAFINVPVAGDVSGVNFKNTTSHTISGKFTGGCNDYIGTAVLEFYDVLPNDANNQPRPSEFRKRVTTTAGTGDYSISLPARKYRVKVISFSPAAGSGVTSIELLEFFNTKVPEDSLTRDITTSNTILSIVYNRAPTLSITGLDPICNTPQPFSIIRQVNERTIIVNAWQGPASKNCPVIDTTLTIVTNIQKDDQPETLTFKTTNGRAEFVLTGGTPNIVAPHFKQFNASFKDIYGRIAQQSRNVVVTGVKSNVGTFTTVSPQVPLMVLHDPPGDNSSSTWETTNSSEVATRFYAAKSSSAEAWAQVKLGAKFSAGLFITTESSIYGQIKGTVGITERQNNASESILTYSTTQNFSTSNNPLVVGSDGDVFMGAALNLLYSVANELVFTPPCTFTVEKKLIVANDGFATTFIFSENHIRNSLIPGLRLLSNNPSNSPEQTREYLNQIKVWEQTLANNDANKARASFVENISFDGASGPVTRSTTTSSTRINTVEFEMAINAQVAIELGFEIAGSGLSGGVNVGFKMETGQSRTNTTMQSTTISYTLDDDDNGDFFSVDVKKDPVYNTPVFQLVAGTASCPNEPQAQPRDDAQIICLDPIKTNIPSDGEAEFLLLISNLSQSNENRTYTVSFDQSSNPNGASVFLGNRNNTLNAPVYVRIDPGQNVNIPVFVRRGLSNVFSYEGLRIRVTDSCFGSFEKTVRVSAYFNTTCGGVTLSAPENGWILNQASNQTLSVVFKDYNVANITSVALEYQRQGTTSWTTALTRTAAQLSTSGQGTEVLWNIGSLNLLDGTYSIRVRINCPSGIIYSERKTGIIDRQLPFVLGKPEPTDDEFVTGDQLIVTYSEPLDCGGVTPSDIELRRLSNNELVAVTVGCSQNKIVIVPLVNIAAWVGDSLRVSVRNISDLNGNDKTSADSWRFVVGSSIPATGARALNLNGSVPGTGGSAFTNPAKYSVLSGPTVSVLENSGNFIRFSFEFPTNASNDVLINYTMGGTAVFGKDFNLDYSHAQNLSTKLDGVNGRAVLRKGTRKLDINVYPIGNEFNEPDKTIIINLAEGGDYDLGSATSVTGIILNDDAPRVFTFIGSGNYNVASNWEGNRMPPNTLLPGDEVIINPAGDGTCIVNIAVTVVPGSQFNVVPGKKMRVNSNLQIRQKL